MTRQKIAGFSTLECLVCLGLLSLLVMLSFPPLRFLVGTHVKQAQELRKRAPLERAQEELSREMTSSLSLYALPPTLLSPQETALKAKRGSLSAGLLLTALQPDRVLRVVHTEPVLLCTGDKEWRISKGWVALTVDGLHVLRGALEQQMSSSEEGPAPCQGQLRLTGRFTTEDGEAPPPNMLALFPLRDRVLYYLSAEGDLRRLSLLTGEHQPVVRGLQELQFTPERNGPAQRMTTTIRGDERELHFVRSFPHPPSLFDLL